MGRIEELSTTIIATALVVAVSLAIPIAVMDRAGAGVLPLGLGDVIFVPLVAGWILVVRALVERNDPADSTFLYRYPLVRHSHRLVEISWFGSGIPADPQPLVVGLAGIAIPQDSVAALLPPPESPVPGPMHQPAAKPVLNLADEHDELGFDPLATEEFVVERGDTFWSIAERTTGDGRNWTGIRQINLGREVAPGVVLELGDELRIGWTILVPLSLDDDSE